jgi:hypothetical protein
VAPPQAGAVGNVTAGSIGNSYPAGGGNASQNQGVCKLILVGVDPSWATGQQWADLVSLWTRESNWDNTIWNGGSHADTQPAGSSGAYGIAQSLPYTKYPKSGWPKGYGGSSSAAAQMTWGLNYIKQTYGSPSAAWAHEQSAGWY